MDKQQSIALYNEGKDAWNKWANGMLAKKKRLEEAGEWEEKERCWKDKAKADFQYYNFKNSTDFAYFIFPGDAWFHSAKFFDDAWFHGATFFGKALFRSAIFSSHVGFNKTIFSDKTLFHGVTFSGNAWFEDAKFFGPVRFNAIFNRYAYFSNAKFIANPSNPEAIAYTADFKAVKSEFYFDLYGTKFEQVPDFTQSHFLEAPSLDRIVIGPKARENPTRPLRQSPSPHGEPVEPREGGIKGGGEEAILRRAQDEEKRQAHHEGRQEFKKEEEAKAVSKELPEKQQIPSRWRHLRRLATQGMDHENEANFFAEEIKSRRGVFDFPRGENWQRWWAGWLYQLFSDFGRSIVRPFCWWLGGIALYFLTLLTTHDFIANNRPPFELGPNGCLLGDSTPWSTAVKVAFDNALFLPQFGVSSAQGQENLCLFGYDIGLKMPDLPPVPLVPDWIAGLGFFHALFSLIMVFLILLAIRNQFRIK